MSSHTMSPPPYPPLPLPSCDEVPTIAGARQRMWMPGLHSLPNIIVFSLLGGVMYLGHHTGWKLPKISELTGSAAVEADDWCDEHLVPESACIECQPDLLPKPKPFGFCKEHGVAECVIHHPELAQSTGRLRLPSYDTVAAIALTARPENNSRNTMHTSRVQFASAESMAKAGVDVDVVQERPMREAVSANGNLLFDPTRVAHLSSRAPGVDAATRRTRVFRQPIGWGEASRSAGSGYATEVSIEPHEAISCAGLVDDAGKQVVVELARLLPTVG